MLEETELGGHRCWHVLAYTVIQLWREQRVSSQHMLNNKVKFACCQSMPWLMTDAARMRQWTHDILGSHQSADC